MLNKVKFLISARVCKEYVHTKIRGATVQSNFVQFSSVLFSSVQFSSVQFFSVQSSSISSKYFKYLDREIKSVPFFKPIFRSKYKIYHKSNSSAVVLLKIALFKDFQEKMCTYPWSKLFAFGQFFLTFYLSRLNPNTHGWKTKVLTAPAYRQSFQLPRTYLLKCWTPWETHFFGGSTLINPN